MKLETTDLDKGKRLSIKCISENLSSRVFLDNDGWFTAEISENNKVVCAIGFQKLKQAVEFIKAELKKASI